MKRLIALILLLCFILVSCSDDGAWTASFLNEADIVLVGIDEEESCWLSVSGGEISSEQIEFISEDESVVTVEHEFTALNGYFSCKIKSVGEGEAFIYAKIKDTDVKTKKIKVKVVIPDDGIENEHPDNASTNISLIYLSSPVKRGKSANLKIKGLADTVYTMTVFDTLYGEPMATFEGKASDSEGIVEWKWTVPDTAPMGVYKIAVSAIDETAYYYFAVM